MIKELQQFRMITYQKLHKSITMNTQNQVGIIIIHSNRCPKLQFSTVTDLTVKKTNQLFNVRQYILHVLIGIARQNVILKRKLKSDNSNNNL